MRPAPAERGAPPGLCRRIASQAGLWGRRALLAVALAGCTAPLPAQPAGPLLNRIVVADRGWHTDLCLDVNDLAGRLATLTAGFPGVRFLCFGFGERQYLLTPDHGLPEMIFALFPSRAALLMTALEGTPAEAFGEANVVTLGITGAGAAGLTVFLWQSLQMDGDGAPIRVRDGPYPGSMFYAARGTYDALTTCNTWSASGLRAAGLPVNAAVVFASQVMRQARRIAAAQVARGAQ